MEAISATIASASQVPTLTEAPDNATLDKDAFLKLLVAQLKYQDPTAPTDVSQMMAQTSQLTMVEQLDKIAAGIEQLSGSSPISSAASMLGRQITFDTGFGPISGLVDAVRIVEGQVVLSAGGHEIPLTAVLGVIDVAAAAAHAAAPAPTDETATEPADTATDTTTDTTGEATPTDDSTTSTT